MSAKIVMNENRVILMIAYCILHEMNWMVSRYIEHTDRERSHVVMYVCMMNH